MQLKTKGLLRTVIWLWCCLGAALFVVDGLGFWARSPTYDVNFVNMTNTGFRILDAVGEGDGNRIPWRESNDTIDGNTKKIVGLFYRQTGSGNKPYWVGISSNYSQVEPLAYISLSQSQLENGTPVIIISTDKRKKTSLELMGK